MYAHAMTDPTGTAAIVMVIIVVTMALVASGGSPGVFSSRSAPKSTDAPKGGEK